MRFPTNWLWTIVFLLLILPWLALIGLGIFWLWQHHYLVTGFITLASFYGAATLLNHWLKHRQIEPFQLPDVQADQRWSPAAETVWAEIDKMADEVNPADYPLTDSARLLLLAQQVIRKVARHFRPKAGKAELDIPLRNILFITEQVSRDMRQLLDERIPFSHLLTIDEGLKLWKWKQRLEKGHFIYRMGRMLLSPATAIPAELSGFFQGKVAQYPKGLLEQWLLRTLIKKTGYYAIALYSGQLAPPVLAESGPQPESAPETKQPLRILVAGQLKAGKSSLINALLGELRAATNVLPLTDELTVYKLAQDDSSELLIFDSPGYGDKIHWFEKEPERALGGFDLVLLVCSATQAGREADAQFLTDLRNWFDQRLHRSMPPVLAIVTHIDQLRPLREWQPPYDVQAPQNEKACNIRDALETVSEALHIAMSDCIPISLQTTGGVYNIDAIWAALADKWPESKRAQYLRCLPEGRSKEKLRLIWMQMANLIRI
ncbi:GTPase [Methylobacter sp.]|uniref:GTPase n=1 Tax=Methylobacter sp. TaxID=2051955 RepID=UPI003DA31A58